MPKKNVDWSKVAAHRDAPPATSEASARHADETPASQAPTPEAPRPKRARREPKFPASYRMPADVLDMVDAAVEAAADNGVKLSKEDAVAAAIRAAYGDLL